MCLSPVRLRLDPMNPFDEPRGVTVSCGKCLECQRQRSLEWAFRICDEAKLYKENCFLTLTYDDDHLPEDRSVSRREVQLFMKSLRQELSPLRIRFFACGEYGKKKSRPHYHLIIFNWFPSDAFLFSKQTDKRSLLFRSPLLEKLWKKGYSSVGKLTFDSALYCAKYMNKVQFNKRKILGDLGDGIRPPFIQMSTRPGVGYSSAFSVDLDSDRIYNHGRSMKIPRYYLKVLEREGVYLDEFKERRELQGAMAAEQTDLVEKRKQFFKKFYENKHVVKFEY